MSAKRWWIQTMDDMIEQQNSNKNNLQKWTELFLVWNGCVWCEEHKNIYVQILMRSGGKGHLHREFVMKQRETTYAHQIYKHLTIQNWRLTKRRTRIQEIQSFFEL